MSNPTRSLSAHVDLIGEGGEGGGGHMDGEGIRGQGKGIKRTQKCAEKSMKKVCHGLLCSFSWPTESYHCASGLHLMWPQEALPSKVLCKPGEDENHPLNRKKTRKSRGKIMRRNSTLGFI